MAAAVAFSIDRKRRPSRFCRPDASRLAVHAPIVAVGGTDEID
nr:hypothetical protein [Burkholderia ambifaria]